MAGAEIRMALAQNPHHGHKPSLCESIEGIEKRTSVARAGVLSDGRAGKRHPAKRDPSFGRRSRCGMRTQLASLVLCFPRSMVRRGKPRGGKPIKRDPRSMLHLNQTFASPIYVRVKRRATQIGTSRQISSRPKKIYVMELQQREAIGAPALRQRIARACSPRLGSSRLASQRL
jgi:hypothetical protein